MKRARFSEEQIVGILKEHEAGRKVVELAREHGISEAPALAPAFLPHTERTSFDARIAPFRDGVTAPT